MMPTDEELLRRAAKRAIPVKRPLTGIPRWKSVSDTFLLGSTYAYNLCVRLGIDPDEMVHP